MISSHASCDLETMTESVDTLGAMAKSAGTPPTVLSLEAQIESQKTTIRSLKALLDQHKLEIESLHKHHTCSGKKENVETPSNRQVLDAECKVRLADSRVAKLASEVCFFELCGIANRSIG